MYLKNHGSSSIFSCVQPSQPKKKNAEKPRPNLGWISQAFRSPFFAMMGCVSWLQGNRGETWFRAPVPFPKCKGTWISQYATSGSLNDFKCRLYWESNLGHIKRPWRYWTFLRESQSSKRFHLLESFGGTKLETLLTSHFQGHARDCVRKSLKCLKYTSLWTITWHASRSHARMPVTTRPLHTFSGIPISPSLSTGGHPNIYFPKILVVLLRTLLR